MGSRWGSNHPKDAKQIKYTTIYSRILPISILSGVATGMVGLLKIKQSSKIDAHGSSSVLFGHVPRFSRAPFDYNQRTPHIQIPARFNLLQTLHCTQFSIALSSKINNNTNNSIFYSVKAGWWFGTCFIFPYIGNNNPN